MLNPAVGVIEQIGERPRIMTREGMTGHALYGPYIDLHPGRYAIIFEIAGEQAEVANDSICAVIDVTAEAGQRDLALDRILSSDISGISQFELEFDVSDLVERVEFRVWTTGILPLLISDDPVLRRRERDEPAINRLQLGPGSIAPQLIKRSWLAGVKLDVRNHEIVIASDHFDNFKSQMLIETDRLRLAGLVVDAVGYRGCGENSLYRAFVGTERPLCAEPQPIPLTSTLCHQTHFGYDQYRFWQHALKETPKYQRKQWEFFFIAQALFERGFLVPGRRGLVFGAGEEQLPAVFASFGVHILATDQAPDEAVGSGWARSHEHTYDVSALNQRSICTDRMFADLVSFEPLDMNSIPSVHDEQFDFCWSACALEHLGSLEKGLSFIENSMRTLRPGGVAVHTTEFNLSSNDETLESEGLSLYRRQDIDRLFERLRLSDYDVSPIDWEIGEGFAEMVVDVAPFSARGEPHIRLKIGQFDCTSIGIIVRKPETARNQSDTLPGRNRRWLRNLLDK